MPNPVYQDGRVYASLPTRIESNLPIHTDGRWSLARDRNTFVGDTSGNIGKRNRLAEDAVKAEWNEVLASKVASVAYARVLRTLAAGEVPGLAQKAPLLAKGTHALSRIIHALLPSFHLDNNIFDGMAKKTYELLVDGRAPEWSIFNKDATIHGLFDLERGVVELFNKDDDEVAILQTKSGSA